ncbi:hypothetical protein [Janthinobacterium sp. HH104]|uniref:hypothetical protein n=1 Tax=Janthinobacterium sp. HH104 TaxID=1537276 RepID=UPI0008749E1B|nr:hypothetical protein [Janthinobacterium sp. HH104]
MNNFIFSDFEQSIAFAHSDEGADYIAAQYVGQTSLYQGYASAYKTPVAAALGALAYYDVKYIDKCGDFYSVYVVRCDGVLLYCADIGHNDDMTHTDRDGFIYFLKGEDWTDRDWGCDIYDLEIDVEGCMPSSLTFDPEDPWTLHEVRAIAKFGNTLIAKPDCYYQTAFPEVIGLDNGEALLVIYSHSKIKWYGVLSNEDLENLNNNVEQFHITDVNYVCEMFKGKKLCYYSSEVEEEFWDDVNTDPDYLT